MKLAHRVQDNEQTLWCGDHLKNAYLQEMDHRVKLKALLQQICDTEAKCQVSNVGLACRKLAFAV